MGYPEQPPYSPMEAVCPHCGHEFHYGSSVGEQAPEYIDCPECGKNFAESVEPVLIED